MRVTYSDSLIQLLKQGLADPKVSLPSFHGSLRGGALNILYTYPELGRHPEIYPLLERALFDKRWIEDRIYASIILHEIGSPLGILHLTYNSLATHPLLDIRQDDLHGWNNGWLIRHAEGLTDECIDLLIKELRQPNGYLHVDILSTLPSEKIVPHMLTLIDAEEKVAMAAAYVLAIKSRNEGRSILEKLVESQKYVEFALIALSHIPDDKTVHYLRVYADPQHAIYQRYRNSLISKLLRHVEIRLFLLNCRDSQPARRAMERFYLHPMHELMENARRSTLRALNSPKYKKSASRPDWEEESRRWIYPSADFNRSFFVVNSHLYSGDLGTGVSAPDFLWEFSTPEDRAYCAEMQRQSIRSLLSLGTIDWTYVGNGDDMGIEPKFLWGLSPSGRERKFKSYYVPGFEITFEPDDYERAATEWILEPQKYRFGSYRPLANYEGNRSQSEFLQMLM